jgi:hypothetical protein
MQQNFANGEACCFTGRPSAIDPMDVENVVPAGDVCGANRGEGGGCGLAAIYFPSQVYRAGYRPEEALSRGSLFPELIFPYNGRREN